MNMKQLVLIVFTYYFCSEIVSSDELFSADHHLDELFDTEEAVIEIYARHLKRLQARVKMIKQRIKQLRLIHETFYQHPRNPVSAYLLLKRLTLDWDKVKELFNNDSNEELSIDLRKLSDRFQYPDEKDLDGIIRSLLRLKNVYHLEIDSLADGKINGIPSSAPLTADDCFQIAIKLSKEKNYQEAELWVKKAIEKIKTDDTCQLSIKKQKSLSMSITCEEIIDKYEHFLQKITREIDSNATIDGRGRHALENIDEDSDASVSYEEIISDEEFAMYLHDFTRYKKICRGNIHLNEDYRSILKCRYIHNNNPFLLIAPFKEEEAYLNPKIAIYHDILSEEEIETVKRISQHSMIRGGVYNSSVQREEIIDYRISKATSFDEDEHPLMGTIHRRVRDITSLDTESADSIQIINYGIGGHFEPHFDYFDTYGERGDRIATTVIYIGNVSIGGETVFPRLNVTLHPYRGSLALWYNLKSSGQGDARTIHASCPVVHGSKWIMTLWIRELGNELSRLCESKDAPPISTINT